MNRIVSFLCSLMPASVTADDIWSEAKIALRFRMYGNKMTIENLMQKRKKNAENYKELFNRVSERDRVKKYFPRMLRKIAIAEQNMKVFRDNH